MGNIKVIAWDFDGVLNRNVINGHFIWADTFEEDIGHSMDTFGDYIFRTNLHAIITGKDDLLDHIKIWAKDVNYKHDPQTILDYWFPKDASPDPMTIQLLETAKAKGIKQVIATNNEDRRTTFIENQMGFESLVDHVFASGRMGSAKPDPSYFHHITKAMKVEPSEIFFVDDLAENVDAALKYGWQAFHFVEETKHLLKEALAL